MGRYITSYAAFSRGGSGGRRKKRYLGQRMKFFSLSFSSF